MSNGYQINKKDIDTVLTILKRTDPDNATVEKAIEFLGNMFVVSYEIKKIKGTGV